MLKGLFQFLKSKTFLINIGVYLILLFILIWFVLDWMGTYTHHDKIIEVPSFKGIEVNKLDEFVKDKNIRYLIIDSIYDNKSGPGKVISQEPLAKEKVKDGRTIYLYVSSFLPPKVSMPKLVDRSFRQASTMISSYGLKLGKTEFIPDPCSNCILNQKIRGRDVEPGTMIPKGSYIDLTIGKGLSDEEVKIPCFYGLTIKEVVKKLAEVSLSLGSISFDTHKDSLQAKVYLQEPTCADEKSIFMGEAIDFSFTTDNEKIEKAISEGKEKE